MAQQPAPSPPQQAPQIPNLITLRSSGGGLRGLARRRAGNAENGGAAASPVVSEQDAQLRRDKIIQQTDNDASLSRMAAVKMGYLDDPFGQYFINVNIPKRYPIINRGTYMRTTAIDHLVENFLATDATSKKQIISLGAGSDTRFFRLCARDKGVDVVYHELDFPVNTTSKITAIERVPALRDTLTSDPSDSSSLIINQEKTSLYSDTLNIHPIDLRSLAAPDIASLPPHFPNLHPGLPTLIISECCLCYIPPDPASEILSFFLSLLKSSTAIVLYEPIRPNDSFGKVMVSNLSSRGIELRTVKKYGTLASQRERLNHVGFTAGQGGRSIETLYYGEDRDGELWVQKEERARVERLEWLDEIEEWKLLANHYCIAWGWRLPVNADATTDDFFARAWKDIKGGFTSAEEADDLNAR